MWQLVSYSWRSNYTAFWLTEWYHSWPHVDYKSFKIVEDSSFQPDSQEYFQTLLFLAAIPLAWLLLTILTVFLHCCYRFVHKSRSSSLVHSPKKNPTTKKWFLAIVALFSLGFVVLGFYGNEETATGVNSFTNAAKDANTTMNEITTQVNEINATYNSDIPIDVQNLNVMFQSVSDPQKRTELLNLTTKLDQYTTSTANNIVGISNDANSVKLDLTSKANALEDVEYFRWLGTITLFCLEIIVCLIALCAVGKGSRCLLVFVSVICVFFIILIWCRMAIEVFITVGASDFCVKPNNYVLSYTEENTEIDQDVVEYYLTCYPNSENPYGSPLRDAQKSQALAETTLNSIQEIAATAYPPATDTLNKLEQTFQATGMQLQDLVASINCNTLNSDYVIGLYSLCYDTITGISFMMVGSILSGLFFTVLIFLSSCTVPVIARRKADYEVDREDPFLPPDNPSATLERFSRRNESQRSPQRQSGLGSPTIPDYNREPNFAASSVAYNQDHRYEDDPLLRRHGHDSPPPSYNIAVTRQSSVELELNNPPGSESNCQSYIQHLGQGDGVMQRALIY